MLLKHHTMKTLLFLLLPLSLTAQPYLGGSLALGTYTKTVHRNYTPILNVEAGYIVHWATAEALVSVPLDNNHPLSVALHAGIVTPGRLSFMLMAGTEYHYGTLYSYPLDDKQTTRNGLQFSGLVRVMLDNPADADDKQAKIYVSVGYSQRMPVAGVGIVAVLK